MENDFMHLITTHQYTVFITSALYQITFMCDARYRMFEKNKI